MPAEDLRELRDLTRLRKKRVSNRTAEKNRIQKRAEEIINLYQFIADQAPGSYGLLYTRDDEDIEGYDNEFRVFVLARGIIQQKEDVLLSPFVPIVEDNNE